MKAGNCHINCLYQINFKSCYNPSKQKTYNFEIQCRNFLQTNTNFIMSEQLDQQEVLVGGTLTY